MAVLLVLIGLTMFFGISGMLFALVIALVLAMGGTMGYLLLAAIGSSLAEIGSSLRRGLRREKWMRAGTRPPGPALSRNQLLVGSICVWAFVLILKMGAAR